MWDQAKIQSYIDNQIEENLNLDYKASGSLESTEPKKRDRQGCVRFREL